MVIAALICSRRYAAVFESAFTDAALLLLLHSPCCFLCSLQWCCKVALHTLGEWKRLRQTRAAYRKIQPSRETHKKRAVSRKNIIYLNNSLDSRLTHSGARNRISTFATSSAQFFPWLVHYVPAAGDDSARFDCRQSFSLSLTSSVFVFCNDGVSAASLLTFLFHLLLTSSKVSLSCWQTLQKHGVGFSIFTRISQSLARIEIDKDVLRAIVFCLECTRSYFHWCDTNTVEAPWYHFRLAASQGPPLDTLFIALKAAEIIAFSSCYNMIDFLEHCARLWTLQLKMFLSNSYGYRSYIFWQYL